MKTVLCAPDKFRGALTSQQAAAAMCRGAQAAGWSAIDHPLADGGEGTREIIVAAAGGKVSYVDTVDALGRAIRAPYIWDGSGTATVVAADVIGVAQLTEHELDPLRATSRGLAAPILAARAAGATRVIVFVGGVATVDGGLGLIAALGGVVESVHGRLSGTGRDLLHVHRIDLEPALRTVGDLELVVATDVASPLYGANGAAHVFAPQKGADEATVHLLDRGLENLAGHLGAVARRPGAGAAGGLGAALMALNAARVSGAEALLELTDFRSRVRRVDLCLTGEGNVDRSTAAGKAAVAVIDACRKESVPCVVLGGTVTREAEDLYAHGPAGIFAIGRRPRVLATAMAETAEDLERTTRAVCTLAGMVIARASPAGSDTGSSDVPSPRTHEEGEATSCWGRGYPASPTGSTT